MGLVSPQQSNAGETIEASDINNPINQLATVINGGIDAANLADNGITNAKIANGVSSAKLLNPYKFRSFKNGQSLTTTANWNKVQFNSSSYDTGTNFDYTTNFRFTVPVTGFYYFSANTIITTDSGSVYGIAIWVNGLAVGYEQKTATAVATDHSYAVSGDLKLAASDYVEVYVLNGSGSAKTMVSCYFSGHLISTT